MNTTMALRKIRDLTGLSILLNRDASVSSQAKCQVWADDNGDFKLVATGRTWESVVNSIAKSLNK